MYGEDGRLIRSIVTREVEWDDEQRAWMTALADYEAGLCPLCGRHTSECTDPATENLWKVPLPTRCFPTTAVLRARKTYDENPASMSRGLLFGATLAPTQ